MRTFILAFTSAMLLACGHSTGGPDGSIGGGGGGAGGGGGGTVGSGGGDAGWLIAAHPPMPQLINRNNGPVLVHPTVHFIFYPGDPNEADFDAFATKMKSSTYWAATTQEYGVGAFEYAGKQELTGQTAPAMISSTDLNDQMGQWLQLGALGPVDPQGIYTIVFPLGTTVTQPNPISPLFGTISSCTSFGGYHNNATVPLPDGGTENIAYAVIPTCAGETIDGLTDVLSHEWIEAATDPFLTSNGAFNLTGGPDSAFFNVDQDHVIWGVLGGGEAGDLCEFNGPLTDLTPSDLNYVAQRTWSNQAAAADHDPCVPEIPGAFFDAAPVLPETVTLDSAITGMVTTQGITIPIHTSKTIEVDLFSDGPTDGPWTVTADDLLYKYYSNYGFAKTLDFSWDKTQGVNGDKLQLTITVNAQSPIGGGHGFIITSQLNGRVAMWTGLVVEK